MNGLPPASDSSRRRKNSTGGATSSPRSGASSPARFPEPEAPGLSVFLRDGNDVLHTYSTYARGLDLLISTYNYLDLTPLGRNEKDLPYTMSSVRHHDRYDSNGR